MVLLLQTLTIRHTVARVTKVVEKNKTKNASSFRSFPLTDDAVRLFKILLQQEQYYRNHFGKDYIDNDYVFTWEDGHPYSPDYVSHTFHKLLKKYDLPHIRFHDLRHTCASMLLSEGYGLKDVQEWLGHSDIKMTANIYGHLDIRRKRSIANSLEQAAAAVCKAVKKQKTRQNPFGFDAPADLDSHLWSEWRESNSRPLEPYSSALPNCATPGQPGCLESALLL